MSGDAINLVCLYKCKQCGVRLYEHDAKGHLERHGITGVNGNWKTFYTKGRKEQPDRPGARYTPIYKKSKKSEKKPADKSLN